MNCCRLGCQHRGWSVGRWLAADVYDQLDSHDSSRRLGDRRNDEDVDVVHVDDTQCTYRLNDRRRAVTAAVGRVGVYSDNS